jgi:hypothetical protein
MMNRFSKLAQLDVPVGDLGGTEVTEIDEDAERNCDMVGDNMERQGVFA